MEPLLELLHSQFWPTAVVLTTAVMLTCGLLVFLSNLWRDLTQNNRIRRNTLRGNRRRKKGWLRLLLRRRIRKHPNDPTRPKHLVKLVLSERDLYTDYPVPLMGRPDEVYATSQGVLVPVDTKTRNRPSIYNSDRIQVSVYAVLLQYARSRHLPALRKREVADYAYIRCVTPDGVRWRKTELLSEAEIIVLTHRRLALEQGKIQPRYSSKAVACRRCAYRDTCPGAR